MGKTFFLSLLHISIFSELRHYYTEYPYSSTVFIAQLMDRLWNAVASFLITTPEAAPGALELNKFPAIDLNSITTTIRTKSKEVSLKSFRDAMLWSCDEFNNRDFFMVLQFALLSYIAPSIALSVIYQCYDAEMQYDEDDELQQYVFPQCQDTQSCIKRDEIQCIEQSQLTQEQSVSQQPFVQIIQLFQRMIPQILQTQQQQQQHSVYDQYQYQSQHSLQTEQQTFYQYTKQQKKSTQRKQSKGDTMNLIVRIQGEEGQKQVFWRYVYTAF